MDSHFRLQNGEMLSTNITLNENGIARIVDVASFVDTHRLAIMRYISVHAIQPHYSATAILCTVPAAQSGYTRSSFQPPCRHSATFGRCQHPS